MSYKDEQKKLEDLWAESEEDTIESGSEDDIDNISESNRNIDSEQDITIEDEVHAGNSDIENAETGFQNETENENIDGPPQNKELYPGKDRTKWYKTVIVL
ncbi:uncharacterized protein [Leptinotarsa decemlineata]|uniref:uncharacterized protein n=1 Tax=Leptinotarsa decemlineata TaxID=7539 RepID=UPI003D30B3F3